MLSQSTSTRTAALRQLSPALTLLPHPRSYGEEEVDYGQQSKGKASVRKTIPVQELEKAGIDGPERWGKNTERAEQLFSQDKSIIRDVLHTERSTLCQA